MSADIPGLKPEDIKLEVTDQDLIIRGERKKEQTEERRGFYRSERSYGQFYRRIPLPEGANPDQAKASFTNGELRINIPVAEPKRQHREIKSRKVSQRSSDQTNSVTEAGSDVSSFKHPEDICGRACNGFCRTGIC